MIPQDWLKRIRHFEVKTKRLSEELMTGENPSFFKGRGMDFEEVRLYQPGDDVKRIDWNVSARLGETYLKLLTEEREMTVIIAVDVSASGGLGSTSQSKRELAAELASILVLTSQKTQDNVGLLLFTDEVELFVPPGKGRAHALRMIREILYFDPTRKGTSLETALRFVRKTFSRRVMLLLVSDFLDEGFKDELKVSAQRHDLIACVVDDPREWELPDVGWIAVEDSETGEVVELDTGNPRVRELFKEKAKERREKRDEAFRRSRVDHMDFMTGKPYDLALRQFLLHRHQPARGRQ